MAKSKYKNVEVKIQFARSKDDYDNGCFQPSNGGKFNIIRAIQMAEMSNGAMLEIYSKRGLLLGNFGVSSKKEDNAWLIPALEKKGIEVK